MVTHQLMRFIRCPALDYHMASSRLATVSTLATVAVLATSVLLDPDGRANLSSATSGSTHFHLLTAEALGHLMVAVAVVAEVMVVSVAMTTMVVAAVLVAGCPLLAGSPKATLSFGTGFGHFEHGNE